jgi:hypothetical protein
MAACDELAAQYDKLRERRRVLWEELDENRIALDKVLLQMARVQDED